MRIHRWLWASTIALAAVPLFAAPTTAFDPARLSRHVQILGSDAYEGRAPATRGETKTVAYLIEQFRTAGLQPGGDVKDGKRQWTQAVPLLKSDLSADPIFTLRGPAGEGQRLVQGEQIAVRSPLNGQKQIRVNNAPLVFAGYGVAAPERG
ncbi:MAG: peptidase M20, partial [Sphingomicrobium sp.]